MARLYSLKKSREVLHWAFAKFKKHSNQLFPEKAAAMESDLRHLENAILEGDRTKADSLARKIGDFTQKNFKKTLPQYLLEIVVAIIVALLIAVVVRQMWFELYEIPTGSMRPSFKEQDHLTVSKTAFGLNVPLKTKHFMFEPDLVKRGGVVIFSGDNIALPDTDTTYFGIFPYKKRYVKRLIGKPGDTLYFYGGKIYGVDKAGKPIQELADNPWMNKIEHIPFLSFEGERSFAQNNQIIFRQMNIPVGKFQVGPLGGVKGEVFNGQQWVKEEPFKDSSNEIHSYGSLWGIDNFAMARLLTRQELENLTPYKAKDVGEGKLYLELRHHPNLTFPAPQVTREGLRAQVSTFTSIIPLKEEHLKAIMDNLYTGRFVVKNGLAKRYDAESANSFGMHSPEFLNVPDGTYEFYYGKAEKIGWKGMTTSLPKDHPIYQFDPNRVQEFFNLGIEMDNRFAPSSANQIFPHRYAYFYEGDLYLLGAPILKKGDPVLAKFLEIEEKKSKDATQSQPYLAFKDKGSPFKNGAMNTDFIRTFGLKVPEGYYLVLGDNHAMSADSRVFGFVPQDNLQGVPSYLLWPPGERWGTPPQLPYKLFSPPRLIVWGVALLSFLVWYFLQRRRLNKRLF